MRHKDANWNVNLFLGEIIRQADRELKEEKTGGANPQNLCGNTNNTASDRVRETQP